MKKTATVFALAVMFAAPAYANDMSKEQKMEWKTNHYFGKLDTNSDGFISKAEHDSFGNKMFTDADTNGDSKISKSELKAAKMREHAEMKAAKGK